MHDHLICLAIATTTAACSNNAVNSDEQARRAYLGLDASVQKSVELGFDGFNASSSANIAPQTMTGDSAGTLAITGQVDRGASTNKAMRLFVGMVSYSDGAVIIDASNNTIAITYDTSTTQSLQPSLTLSLRDIPSGTLTGTLVGTYTMTGDLAGDVDLDLTLSGSLMAGPNSTVVRVSGSTTITGTATSGDGVYSVDLVL